MQSGGETRRQFRRYSASSWVFRYCVLQLWASEEDIPRDAWYDFVPIFHSSPDRVTILSMLTSIQCGVIHIHHCHQIQFICLLAKMVIRDSVDYFRAKSPACVGVGSEPTYFLFHGSAEPPLVVVHPCSCSMVCIFRFGHRSNSNNNNFNNRPCRSFRWFQCHQQQHRHRGRQTTYDLLLPDEEGWIVVLVLVVR